MKGIISVKQIENNQLMIKYIYKHELNGNVEYKHVASVFTPFNAELIKMFRECYENAIPVKFSEYSTKINEQYIERNYCIEGIMFTLGTKEDCFVLEITIK